ncbi:phosphoribosylformylglycinamidine cyclo-ligase [Deferribacter thermophilus]|uniref:phosphoribosylformylglycinamidine cyclo-ligase n=1 Tax=Deferribacter thermophilus TaxID=53573 RepID=UPI003C2C0334
MDYKSSGVNIDEGNKFVSKIKRYVEETFNKNVLSSIGGFAGLYDISFIKNYKRPILVSGTDGVGTKLKVAIMAERYDTIGIDLVAMCANDVVVTGAKPLFFLDYFATGKLNANKMSDIIKGVSKGCIEAGCSLIGGETAEMPGMYADKDFDLAGFCVGVVDYDQIIDGSKIKPGDVLVGIKSNGFHSNGYSLLRKIFFEEMKLKIDDKLEEDKTVADILLKPTKIYVKDILTLIDKGYSLKGVVHITGGGFYENIPRILPENCSVEIYSEEIPELFEYRFIRENTDIELRELFRVFNMGIGMVLVVEEKSANDLINALNKSGENAFLIGRVVEGNQTVKISGVDF